MFTRILYATDGSDHARKALDYTRDLATLLNAEVIVVHAYPSISDMFGAPEYDEMIKRRLGAGTEVLEEAASRLEEAGVSVVRELLEGPMAEAILRVANVRQCDLIVVGARGLSGLQGLLLGSVSHKVLHLGGALTGQACSPSHRRVGGVASLWRGLMDSVVVSVLARNARRCCSW